MRSIYISAAILTSALIVVGCSSAGNSNVENAISNTDLRNANSRMSNQNANNVVGSSSPTAEDRTFVEKAATGGMAEVQLGEVAVKNAKSQDVKSFGQHMIDDHTKANNELKTLATSKGLTPSAALDSQNKSTFERLSKLTGEQFDKAYMSDMVEDHEKDVAEFQRQSTSTGDPDIRAFAAKTLPTLQQHLMMAKSIASKEK